MNLAGKGEVIVFNGEAAPYFELAAGLLFPHPERRHGARSRRAGVGMAANVSAAILDPSDFPARLCDEQAGDNNVFFK